MKLLAIGKRSIPLIIFAACGVTLYFLLNRLGFLMPLAELPSVLCLTSCKTEPAVHPLITDGQVLKPAQSLGESLGVNANKEKVSILIEKSKHRLTLYYDFQPIKSYPVVFGSSPKGNKLYEGDLKTPEGIFHIRALNPHPNWSKFMWLDYPTPRSWRQHFQAKFNGDLNWLKSIGGQVGIHGVPSGKDDLIDRRANWTWGCISLKNHDVNEIYQFVKIGTIVEIIP